MAGYTPMHEQENLDEAAVKQHKQDSSSHPLNQELLKSKGMVNVPDKIVRDTRLDLFYKNIKRAEALTEKATQTLFGTKSKKPHN
ncbi:MAG TPA: hypothetical protein VFP93_03155 [Gammaproteobacteria bacterium]|nr:hypothetical protein [Gammaproteobacteria bacterium]